MIKNKMMVENEENFDKRGFLNISSAKIKRAMVDEKKYQDYYFMLPRTKDDIDVHILFSQIYSKAGLDVPVYFAAKGKVDGGNEDIALLARDNIDRIPEEKKFFVDYSPLNRYAVEEIRKLNQKGFSNELVLPALYNKMYTVDFCDRLRGLGDEAGIVDKLYLNYVANSVLRATKKLKSSSCFDMLFMQNNLTQIGEENNISPIVEHFKREAIKDKIKMGILDIAFLNNYRSQYSYAYEVSRKDVERVVPLCVEESARNARLMAEEKFEDVLNSYKNDFDYDELPALEVLKRYKHNYYVDKVIGARERMEFGETLRALADSGINKEIEKESGYKVDNKIYDVIMRHLDRTGEELEHLQ